MISIFKYIIAALVFMFTLVSCASSTRFPSRHSEGYNRGETERTSEENRTGG